MEQRRTASNDVMLGTYKRDRQCGPHGPHVSVPCRDHLFLRASMTRVGRKRPRFVKPDRLAPDYRNGQRRQRDEKKKKKKKK